MFVFGTTFCPAQPILTWSPLISGLSAPSLTLRATRISNATPTLFVFPFLVECSFPPLYFHRFKNLFEISCPSYLPPLDVYLEIRLNKPALPLSPFSNVSQVVSS